MRIGIDAREICGRATGVGRYLAGLLAAWAIDPAARRHQFVLYAPDDLQIELDSRRFAARIVPGPAGTWWEQVRLPAAAAADHLDVFFSPGYTTPLFRSLPAVVAIHDVSFAAHPEWFSMREGARRRWLARQAAQQARAVITISDFSKGEIVERFGIQAARVHVIPPGVTPPRRAAASRDAARPQCATALYAGSIFNRRHVPDLIRAFGGVARRHPGAALEIVGDNRTHPHEEIEATIANEGLTGRVTWRRYVSDEALGRLYAGARAFAFLSEYEGLGLTPLEALASRVPPLLLDTPVARESCGAAAMYVPVPHGPQVTDALERLLFDDAARHAVLDAAPAALRRFSWSRAGRDTLALLERAAAGPE